MAKQIISREELLSFVVKRIVYVYIKRAINDGPVENLGGFCPVDPDCALKGWIIKVITRTKRVVHVGIYADWKNLCYTLKLIEEVCWKDWIGDQFLDKKLYAGDNPDQYTVLKEQEKTNEQQTEDD